jgi:DNA-binding NtrC family response regulator
MRKRDHELEPFPSRLRAAEPENQASAEPDNAGPLLVGRTVADVERELILETLKHCHGNRTHAANILGIAIRTLRNKLNEYADSGLEISPPGSGRSEFH